jgi:hypothetical protein
LPPAEARPSGAARGHPLGLGAERGRFSPCRVARAARCARAAPSYSERRRSRAGGSEHRFAKYFSAHHITGPTQRTRSWIVSPERAGRFALASTEFVALPP